MNRKIYVRTTVLYRDMELTRVIQTFDDPDDMLERVLKHFPKTTWLRGSVISAETAKEYDDFLVWPSQFIEQVLTKIKSSGLSKYWIIEAYDHSKKPFKAVLINTLGDDDKLIYYNGVLLIVDKDNCYKSFVASVDIPAYNKALS